MFLVNTCQLIDIHCTGKGFPASLGRGCLIIIWTGLNIKIGIVQKVNEWPSCPFAKILFELCLFWPSPNIYETPYSIFIVSFSRGRRIFFIEKQWVNHLILLGNSFILKFLWKLKFFTLLLFLLLLFHVTSQWEKSFLI